ncbi:hypothetical protein GYMLUDRAFT_221623 [Collybiopsis luxurians FD-317 M1]|uniref:Uncharacterized protein n=1 Tax=Collybiopsis luxurians FD-317 M1 TaxID=944289 RepID=A0A0D0CMD0_9AGAR|nr:hypothetical protein GYMLUDRAFT_221623 [Collybiopsis luxurians FD-317 M1]
MLILTLLSLIRAAIALPTSQYTVAGDSAPVIGSTRSTSGIVWSCITTIFACTWVAIHPNVPSIHALQHELFWRRVKILIVALIAPEFIIIWAANQLRSARDALKTLREFDACRHWTMTHGLFLVMGGFMLIDASGTHTEVLQEENLANLLRNGNIALHHISECEIMDRSKGDALAKSLVLIQTTWFIAQVISRAVLHLPITELELTTVAFALLNFLTYALWWKKPLDVRHPILLLPPGVSFSGVFQPARYTPFTISRVAPTESFPHFYKSTHGAEDSDFEEIKFTSIFGSGQSSLSSPNVDQGEGLAVSTPTHRNLPSDAACISIGTGTAGIRAEPTTQKARLDSDAVESISADSPSILPTEVSQWRPQTNTDLPNVPMSIQHHSSTRRTKDPIRFAAHHARLHQFLESISVSASTEKDVVNPPIERKYLSSASAADAARFFESIGSPSPSPPTFQKDLKKSLSLKFQSLRNALWQAKQSLRNIISDPKLYLSLGIQSLRNASGQAKQSLRNIIRFPYLCLLLGIQSLRSVWNYFLRCLGGFKLWAHLLLSGFIAPEFAPGIYKYQKHTNHVPLFYTGPVPAKKQKKFLFSEYFYIFGSATLEMLIGTLFGSIHCAAWAFHFPSKLERDLWQIMSLCITAVPLAMILTMMLVWSHRFRFLTSIRYLLFVVYILARLMTFIMAFVLLRDLPEGAFQEIQWTTYIPHV